MSLSDWFMMQEAIASSEIEGIKLSKEEKEKLLLEALIKGTNEPHPPKRFRDIGNAE